jgi:hypothetical protein
LRRRLGLLAAVAAAWALVGGAQAQAQESFTSSGSGAGTQIATDIATELAKQGAKAAIAHFAPGLQDKIDPTAAALAGIRAQLDALNTKIAQLQVQQEALASRQLCATHVGTLRSIVSRARTSLEELVAATRLSDVTARESRLDRLWTSLGQLATDQDQLHTTLVDGAIDACGKSLQDRMYPFFTSQLAPQVRDWYATYEAAAVALLTVRLNMYAYAAPTGTMKQVTETDADGKTVTLTVPVRKTQYTEAEAQALAKKVVGPGEWLAREQSLIKPAFPGTESVYLPDKLVFKTRVAPGGLQDGENYRLFKEGWYASIRGNPGCEQLQRIFEALGVGRTARVRVALRERAILYMNSPYVYCNDDHGTLYAYNFDTFKFESAAYIHVYVDRNIGTIMAHSMDGFLTLDRWSYK